MPPKLAGKSEHCLFRAEVEDGYRRTCFYCGKENHFRRECPEAEDGRGRTCFNCGEEGHIMRECLESPKSGKAIGGGRKRAYMEGSREVKDHLTPCH